MSPSSGYRIRQSSFHPHTQIFIPMSIGSLDAVYTAAHPSFRITTCYTPILPDNNMLHSPLGFPIRISCGMIGLLLSPSFLDIFTYRLLKADFDIHPYGRTIFSLILGSPAHSALISA